MIEQYFDWYFDYDDVNPRVKEECPDESDWLEYVMNIVLEVQEIYMEVMDRGDVLHDGRQFTFPVSTVNISKKKLEDGSYEIEDPEFLDNFCKKHDVVRYNIYTAVKGILVLLRIVCQNKQKKLGLPIYFVIFANDKSIV